MRQGQIDSFGEQLRMEGVVRFRDNFHRFECLYFTDHEVLKLFQPHSARLIGGRSADRVLSGNVGIVLRSEVGEADTRKWLHIPHTLSLVPIMNFPNLIRHSTLCKLGEINSVYFDKIPEFLRKIPSTPVEIAQQFGENFFSLSNLDRAMIMARELRAKWL